MYFIIIACSTTCSSPPLRFACAGSRLQGGGEWLPLGIRLPCHGFIRPKRDFQLVVVGWLVGWMVGLANKRYPFQTGTVFITRREITREGGATDAVETRGDVCRPTRAEEGGCRPGNEPQLHPDRHRQTGQAQTSMHDGFYFWKAKRCQQTHVHT